MTGRHLAIHLAISAHLYRLDDGIGIKQTDLSIILFMGAFTIGLGIALVTTGTGYLPAAEVSLLVLIESVLGPLWPWVFLGEALSKLEIIGGAITLLAVITMTLASQKTASRATFGALSNILASVKSPDC